MSAPPLSSPCDRPVNSAERYIMVLILSFVYGKNNLLTAPYVQLVNCPLHFVISFSFLSEIIVSFGILSYTKSPMTSVAAFSARRSAISFPCIPPCAFTQLQSTVLSWSSSFFISSLHSLSLCSVCFNYAVCQVSLWCL